MVFEAFKNHPEYLKKYHPADLNQNGHFEGDVSYTIIGNSTNTTFNGSTVKYSNGRYWSLHNDGMYYTTSNPGP